MSSEKNICVLGSTGSIGTQVLDVVSEIGGIKVKAMTANRNIELFEKQIRKYKPEVICVYSHEYAQKLKDRIKDLEVCVYEGLEGLVKCAEYGGCDTVVNSVVGNIGLVPTVSAIRSGKNIALANKETLVTAGKLVMEEVKRHNVNMYPIDSEHSAIFQCLAGNRENKIRKIILTASGGPFRNRQDLENVTVEDALHHPNWSMGRKITIDSATLMNKGLELIEAKWLFGVNTEDIEIAVHPQSIVHSMVEYEDGAILAQLGVPDMRVPISYALTFPKRAKNSFEKLDIFKMASLTFEKPDMVCFPCLSLAISAINTGGTLPAVMNGANEVAVAAFLDKKIKFTHIPRFIEKTMNAYTVKYDYTLDDVLDADKWARKYTADMIG